MRNISLGWVLQMYQLIFLEGELIGIGFGVRLGGTDVVASVKAELGKPNYLYPDKGKVAIYVDCSCEELSAELSAALQRCLLGGKTGAGSGINLSSLAVVEGKICWDLYIDALVVSSDGNSLDALAAAIKAALSNTSVPKVNVAVDASTDEEPEVDISNDEFLQFDTSGFPVIVTLTKVTNEVTFSYYNFILNYSYENRSYFRLVRITLRMRTLVEESQMSSALSVSVNRHGQCWPTKRGGAGLDPSVILDMISLAKHVSEQLIAHLDSKISAAQIDDDELMA
ncbi:hypothetical protein ACHQM5_003625 [Ranunculus cassubicifolius]